MASGVFGLRGKRLRDAALMGMTAGLAAFFGVALGGSLFALEARPHACRDPFVECLISVFLLLCGWALRRGPECSSASSCGPHCDGWKPQ